MRHAIVLVGAIVLLVALIGFVRSLWRPPHGEGTRYGPTIQGEGQGGDGGGFDGGGHGA